MVACCRKIKIFLCITFKRLWKRGGTEIMKRFVRSILGVALALNLGSMVSFAAVSGCDRHFTDADLDGLCDYCNTACQFTDADEDGLCDSCGFDRHGMETVCRSGYADEDGDGICDYCHTGRHAAGAGCGTKAVGTASPGTSGSGTSGTGHHRSGHGSHHGRSGRHCW